MGLSWGPLSQDWELVLSPIGVSTLMGEGLQGDKICGRIC